MVWFEIELWTCLYFGKNIQKNIHNVNFELKDLIFTGSKTFIYACMNTKIKQTISKDIHAYKFKKIIYKEFFVKLLEKLYGQ